MTLSLFEREIKIQDDRNVKYLISVISSTYKLKCFLFKRVKSDSPQKKKDNQLYNPFKSLISLLIFQVSLPYLVT